jgi:hypothetical protein
MPILPAFCAASVGYKGARNKFAIPTKTLSVIEGEVEKPALSEPKVSRTGDSRFLLYIYANRKTSVCAPSIWSLSTGVHCMHCS